VIIRKYRIRDFLNTILSYVRDAIRTQNDAISRVFAVGYTGYGFPLLLPERLTALCAPESPTIHFALPILGIANSSPVEPESHNLLSTHKWRKSRGGNWWYYTDDSWTGVMVAKVSWIQVFQARQPAGILRLDKPVFRVSHRVKNNHFRINCDIHIVDALSLKKASRIAESYYSKWEAVNSNGTVPLHGACGQRNVTTTLYHKFVTCKKCLALIANKAGK